MNHLPGLTYAGFQGESRLPNPIPACPIAADSCDYVPDIDSPHSRNRNGLSLKPEKLLVLANHNLQNRHRQKPHGINENRPCPYRAVVYGLR